jgi:type IV pilus assembly protein PilE
MTNAVPSINHSLKSNGFTLIELMIVVTVIAILSSIALPSYQEYARRGHRADAQTQLLQAAQYLERRYTTSGNYGETLPSGYTQSPASGTARYNITLVTNTPVNATFVLTATATGSMVGDRCGNFVLAHTAAKSVANASVAADQCWRR